MLHCRDFLEAVTLGEPLGAIRALAGEPLGTPAGGLLAAGVGGAELNIAVGLARLGHRVGFAGAIGDDPFGQLIMRTLREEGVDADMVTVDADAPTGLYLRGPAVLGARASHYFRTGSAGSRMTLDDLDLDRLLSARLLHLSGITAALSQNCRDLVDELITRAQDKGVVVSFDANVRMRLPGDRRHAAEVLVPLARRADLLFIGNAEAALLLGEDSGDGFDPQTALDGLRAAQVIVHDELGASAITRTGFAAVMAREVPVIDTVGAGDALAAGYLSGWLRGWHPEDSLRLGEYAAACVLSTSGDHDGFPSFEQATADLAGVEQVHR